MKRTFLLLVLSFSMFLLFGCKAPEKEITLLDNISSISISESDGYGGMNEKFVMIIDKDPFISEFEKILKHAKEKRLKANAHKEKPDYDILIRYENGGSQGLHLELSNTEGISRIMYIGHENKAFDVSSEDTKKLRDFIEN